MCEWWRHLDRNWVDAQFEAMRADESYCAMQLAIAEEFAPFEREAWPANRTDVQMLRITLDV